MPLINSLLAAALLGSPAEPSAAVCAPERSGVFANGVQYRVEMDQLATNASLKISIKLGSLDGAIGWAHWIEHMLFHVKPSLQPESSVSAELDELGAIRKGTTTLHETVFTLRSSPEKAEILAWLGAEMLRATELDAGPEWELERVAIENELAQKGGVRRETQLAYSELVSDMTDGQVQLVDGLPARDEVEQVREHYKSLYSAAPVAITLVSPYSLEQSALLLEKWFAPLGKRATPSDRVKRFLHVGSRRLTPETGEAHFALFWGGRALDRGTLAVVRAWAGLVLRQALDEHGLSAGEVFVFSSAISSTGQGLLTLKVTMDDAVSLDRAQTVVLEALAAASQAGVAGVRRELALRLIDNDPCLQPLSASSPDDALRAALKLLGKPPHGTITEFPKSE